MPRPLQRIIDATLAALIRAVFAAVRSLGPDRSAAAGAWVARTLGPLFPAHRVALDNIRHAFPDKSAAEHRAILRQAWDNLGRVACEYVHMDRMWDFDPERPNHGRIQASEATVARYVALAEDGKPALIFAAHLANWEIPAVAAAKHGLASAVLYRTPNNARIAADIVALRMPIMGRLIAASPAAPVRMMEALDEGLHVGMLIDQRFGRGPRVPFFGRLAASNPLLPRLARRFPDVPVHGARVIRQPGGRFLLELTERIELPRAASGQVDIDSATALLNRIVEDWIREHPGQWLWMHRRWR
ncbi:MAG: lipid A biosynthesis lauroyl acyltransferase [Acetobacteraceae bacterium]|nr:lipid A biosynthesis lauroyl acyltransferase [Acetobacteraceae bacterium]